MIFSLIIFIWLQKSGGANMHFFKSGGAKAPLPPASDAYAGDKLRGGLYYQETIRR